MFWPFFSRGWPSMSQPSPPSGSETRRGARSCHFSGTYFVHTGGVSTCPSAEITWYLRLMLSLLSPFWRRLTAHVAVKRRQNDLGGRARAAGHLRRLDPQV